MSYETHRVVSTKAGKIVVSAEKSLIKLYHRPTAGIEELILSIDKKEADNIANALQDAVFDLED